MSLFDSSEAKSRIVMFPSNRNGSSVGAENASTMVGSVSELLLEKETLPMVGRSQWSSCGPGTGLLHPLQEQHVLLGVRLVYPGTLVC